MKLTYQQNQLWLASQFQGGSVSFNNFLAYKIEGQLNSYKLTNAIEEIVKNNDSLFYSFKEVNGVPIQEFGIKEKDWSCDLRELDNKNYDEISNNFFTQVFNIEKGENFDIKLIKKGNGCHELWLGFHHIISDGVSIVNFLGEVSKRYNKNTGRTLSENDTYNSCINQIIKNELKGKNYWKESLLDVSKNDRFPATRTKSSRYEGSKEIFYISEKTSQLISRSSMSLFSTEYVVLFSVFARLLAFYRNNDNVTIGTIFDGRNASNSRLFGMFANSIPLNFELTEGESIKEFIKRNQKQLILTEDYQWTPINELGDNYRNLYDVLFVFQHSLDALTIDDSLVEQIELDTKYSINDIIVEVFKKNNQFEVAWTYNSSIYSNEDISKFHFHYELFMNEMLSDTSKDLVHFNPFEVEKLVLKGKQANFDGSIHEEFDTVCESHAHKVALCFNDDEITYSELKDLSHRIASFIKRRQVKTYKDLVIVDLPRSKYYPAVFFGLQKAGYIVVPLHFNDKDHLKEKVKNKYKNVFVFDEDILVEFVADKTVAKLSASAVHQNSYMIFTSGTTGEPKGIMISQKAIWNTIKSQIKLFRLSSEDVGTLFAPFSFDASISEMLTVLLVGGKLIIVDQKTRENPEAFEKLQERRKMSFMTLTPTYLSFLNEGKFRNVKLVVAGEVSRKEDFKRFSKNNFYINAYGPTETTICATVRFFEKGERFEGNVLPIGNPIHNSRVLILNIYDRPLPFGATGQLSIGGEGLSEGYFENKMLTQKSRVELEGVVYYKSGDQAYINNKGEVVCIGRNDSQVKINGIRVELGEIKSFLLKGVIENLELILIKNKLICFYTSTIDHPKIKYSDYSEYLRPEFFPTTFIKINEFPVDKNGKLDKTYLLEVFKSQDEGNLPYSGSNLNKEYYPLAKVFNEVLGVNTMTLNEQSDFFHLGGSSIALIRLNNKIKDESGVDLGIEKLLTLRTLGSIQKEISKNKKVSFVYEF
jgi:non-ribosomal peptide synthetase component F/acyl carrier protein